MLWCKCPNCSHKLFMYDSNEKSGKAVINIKCSSCKKIVDVLILNERVEVKIYEHEKE